MALEGHSSEGSGAARKKREEQTGNREINRRAAQNHKETERDRNHKQKQRERNTHNQRQNETHKGSAHAQGPTNTDTKHKEAPHPPTTLEQRPHRGRH